MRCLLLLSMRRYMRRAPWPVGWFGCMITTRLSSGHALIQLLKLSVYCLTFVLHFLMLDPRSILFRASWLRNEISKTYSKMMQLFWPKTGWYQVGSRGGDNWLEVEITGTFSTIMNYQVCCFCNEYGFRLQFKHCNLLNVLIAVTAAMFRDLHSFDEFQIIYYLLCTHS